MEKLKFCYDNHNEIYDVFDAFDYYQLLGSVDKNFTKLFKWLPYMNEWVEIKK